jgi:hypothetical protein
MKSRMVSMNNIANAFDSRPEKITPVKLEGYYYWEDHDGNTHKGKLDTDISIVISEDTSPETVAKMVSERLNQA